MQTLSFPLFHFTYRHDKGKTFILDPVRKKYVRLTPEEWVRQHVIRYLCEVLGYPMSHMAIEKGLTINTLSKRIDLLMYDRAFNPSLIVECKAPEVMMTNAVYEQASRYNLGFSVPWLFITNGISHHAAYINHQQKSITPLISLPRYDDLESPPSTNLLSNIPI
jgi:hypothetical protein